MSVAHHLPWSAVQAECDALLRRLREGLTFREGLLQSLILAAINSTEGDFGSPQRLSFLWRQAHQIEKWENLLELGEHVREVLAVR